ncbi:uncharacterized protein LOC144159683 isoform X4 [Haemaphysalis longicornis]
MKPRRILLLLVLLCVADCGSCQRRVRLVPPMNATAVCPTSLGDARDVGTTLWFFPNGSRIVASRRTVAVHLVVWIATVVCLCGCILHDPESSLPWSKDASKSVT